MNTKHTATPIKCSGDAMIGRQCPKLATWVNQNGVYCCDKHKLILDAFTWESLNTRNWQALKLAEEEQP